MYKVFFYEPGIGGTMKLWLRRTLVLPEHYAANAKIEAKQFSGF
ncbi:hypothetical protein [Panacibacter microcysteis]|nr:hypothetical protein [Panacibacter microcysteis]